jgi:hypothetical protein
MGARVAVFGTFYPMYQFAGNSTTGAVLVAAGLEEVDSVTVYCQAGARMPDGVDASKVRLRPVWEHDRPGSLVRALWALLRAARRNDQLVFNIYVTSFGRTSLSNGIGLLLPPLVAAVSGRPVTVYMHNFVETQDVEGLGYAPGYLVRRLVHALEALVLRNCEVIVPLGSQRDELRGAFGSVVRTVYLPYVEGVLSALTAQDGSVGAPSGEPRTLRLLIFGSLGPQKDLTGALELLDEVAAAGAWDLRLTVAGGTNRRFPEAAAETHRAIDRVTSLKVERVEDVDDASVLELLARHDLMLLPYNATGGISGALNIAALAGLSALAYDHPQLREQAGLLGAEVHFMRKGSKQDLLDGLNLLGARSRARQRPGPAELTARLEASRTAVRSLLHRSAP